MTATPFDLLISDCDGVLVDSEVLADRVMLDALGAYVPRVELEQFLAGSFGLTAQEIVQRVQRQYALDLPPGLYQEIRTRSEALIAAEVQPIDGVREALLALPLPLAVASNSMRESVVASVARAGLRERVGERIFSADMVARPKPAPDVYLLAARTLEVAPERCLVIEDSATGASAALAAGMTVIGFTGAAHIPAGHAATLRQLGVAAVMEHMRELPQTYAALVRAAAA
ncbi:HAD-IA family hydrolase [Xanthomonas sp. PPL568]|uniref:HAD-IA family hydrolase n=1 Tax=Xanthomonas TaxID=338 RepID=UPI00136B3262|nr:MULTISPECIES: HAD-IA family hydrolase [Xanthomonas]MBB6366468.1 HAD superfamily hydrolase (TIGR01509 family) [Xanthomonas sp. F10]MCI2244039.1 HAD-IA family hydrolase [Xanthomonas indica]MXV34603.1 HAD family hydrolase [Xanthomonas sp. LMG 8989]